LTTEAHCLGFLPSKNAKLLAKQPKNKQNKNNPQKHDMTLSTPPCEKECYRSNLILTQSSENRHGELAGLNFEMYLTLLYA